MRDEPALAAVGAAAAMSTIAASRPPQGVFGLVSALQRVRCRNAGVIALASLALAACMGPSPWGPSRAEAPIAPPATMRPPTTIALVNPGFESDRRSTRGDPEGWFSFQHAGDLSYRFVVDTAEKKSGTRSLRVDNIGPEPYGALSQSTPAAAHVGKVARLSGWLKTRNANDNGAVLTLLALRSGATLAQNFMLDKPVKGTTGWTRYAIVLVVPPGTDAIEAGVMMRGKGSVWFDDAELDFVTP